ncbi:MAG TPA: type II toxin-antitoxin system HicB family antitoxin [Chloroflexia bacterium]|nr:type II toxin-antitoxin system HicB family antitoxin [Chloroflexia bacterium]
MRYKVLVVLEKAPRNYSAYAPNVPGCIAAGKTIEETLELMQEALQAHLEWMAQDGDLMPEISAVDAHVLEIEVSTPTTVTA